MKMRVQGIQVTLEQLTEMVQTTVAANGQVNKNTPVFLTVVDGEVVEYYFCEEDLVEGTTKKF